MDKFDLFDNANQLRRMKIVVHVVRYIPNGGDVGGIICCQINGNSRNVSRGCGS